MHYDYSMSKGAEFQQIKEREPDFSEYQLSQARAGSYAAEVVQDMEKKTPGLIGLFRSLERLRAGRGLCAVTATSMAINTVLRKRIISDADAKTPLRVGDYYKIILPHHNELSEDPHNGEQKRWWVINPHSLNTYHHALLAFARGFGLSADGVGNFADIRAFGDLVGNGGSVVLSIRNSFVREVTTGNDPECFFEQDGKIYVRVPGENGQLTATEFLPGTHAITLVDFSERDGFTYLDSYSLPQQKVSQTVRTIEPERLSAYLPADLTSRKAIMFDSKPVQSSEQSSIRDDYIPEQVQKEITSAIRQSLCI